MKGVLASVLLLCACRVLSCSAKNKYSKRENKEKVSSEEISQSRQNLTDILGKSSEVGTCRKDFSDGCTSNNECCTGFCDKDPSSDSGICKPPCGKSDLSFLQQTISNARNAKQGEFPWHAGIYQHSPRTNSYFQICGGTMVSAKVVITAAHCVSGKSSTILRVGLGKYYRSLDSPLDDLAQIIDVEKIEIPPEYQGGISFYGHNIAILTLKRNVIYSRVVRPVCIDIGPDNFEQDQLIRGATGMVLGWGFTTDQTPSETLKIMSMPYVPKEECASKLGKDLKPFLTKDRICAGGDESSKVTVCQGDSGGGLVFQDRITKAYYLRGIVSAGPKGCKGGDIVLFTNLTYFRDLVGKYVEGCNEVTYSRTCGRSANQEILTQGRAAEINEFPWHVGIYKYEEGAYRFLCGGTLVSRKVIVSAAHCIATSRSREEKITVTDSSKLKIAVGKQYRDFNSTEDNQAQILDVENIEISNQYLGEMALQANDIVFLTLKAEVIFTPAVRPVCLDVGDDNFEHDHLVKDSIGKIAAWGITTVNTIKDSLKVLEMPYVPREECKNKIHFRYVSSVTEDKICAGDKISRATLCNGDSGEGIVFEDAETNAYYLRGIVSLSPNRCQGQEFILFTKMSSHRKLVEKYVQDCEGVCKRKKCEPLTSKKLYLSCFTPDGQPTRCDKPLPTNSRANFTCNPPSYYKMKEPEYNTIQCKNGRWDRPLIDDFCHAVCGKSVPKIAHQPVVSYGKKIEYGEFPWHVGLYEFNETTNKFEQSCGGTIVSRNLVVSAAHCVTEETRYRNATMKDYGRLKIAVGKYYRSFNSSADETLAQIIDIENVEIPWRYLGVWSLYDYDIAFITLRTAVEFSPAVAPICLDIGENTFEEEQLRNGGIGKVVGWGLTLEKIPSETLIMAEMPYVPRDDCIDRITNNLLLPANRDNMICAGDKDSSMSVCQGDSGGGLVFEEPESQKYYLRGVVSLGPKGCKGQEYALFTKLSSYKEVLKKYLHVP